MVACFRQGFVLPCNEQLRPKDSRCASPPPTRTWWSATSATPTSWPPPGTARRSGRRGTSRPSRRHRGPEAHRPVPDHVHISAGEPKGVLHGQRYLLGQRLHVGGSGCRRGLGVVHGRLGLVEVGAQRLHRPVAARGGCSAPRRPLRPRRAPQAASSASASTCCAWPPSSTALIAKRATLARPPGRPRGSRRGAQARGAARPGTRATGRLDPRRLRPDRDRPRSPGMPLGDRRGAGAD